jgi:cation-transporting ATPase 13A2
LEERGNALAIVINTGYSTRRGRIIRKILNRVPNDPDFFMSAIYFLTETFIVGIILYLGTLPILFHAKITKLFRVFRFLDFLGWSFPPTFPIYFNLAYSFALARLRIKGINGT